MNGITYNSNLNQVMSEAVDYKLYRLSQIAVWRDYWRFSGIQLKFEVPSEFTGYPPIIKTIGSTRLASLYTVLDNQ